MPNNLKLLDKQTPIQLTPDFLGEDRHEFVATLAYKFWEQRGRPLGSPKLIGLLQSELSIQRYKPQV